MALFDFLRKKEASIPLYQKVASYFGGLFGGGGKAKLEYYNGWVFACIRAIAEEVANIDLHLYSYKSDGTKEEVHEHPAIDLINQVNPHYTKYTLFERLQSFLELDGNEYWFLEYNGKKEPQEIYPLRYDSIDVIPDPKNYVGGYKYKVGQETFDLKPNQVIHFKNFNPVSDLRGMGTLDAARIAADTDIAAREYNRMYFANSARPDIVLEYPTALTVEQEKRLKEAWEQDHKGANKQFKTAIASGGLKISAFQISQRDMEFMEQRKFSRDEIMAIFRVPPIVLGIAEVTTYASAKAAAYSFALRTIKPKMQRILDTLNEYFLPLFGDPSLAFEFSNPVPDDRTETLAEYKDGLASGWLSINDVRRREGLPLIQGGEQVFLPFSVTPFGAPEAQPTKAARPIAKEVKAMAQEIAKTLALPAKKAVEPVSKVEQVGELKAQARDNRANHYVKKIKEALATLWAAQQKRATESLIADLGKKNWKAKLPNLLDDSFEVKATIDLLGPIFAGLTEEEGKAALEFLGKDPGAFDIAAPAVAKFLKANTKRFAEGVTAETTRQLRATIAAGVEQGEAIDDLKDRISGIAGFDAARADMVARTESIRAQSQAEVAVWEDTGEVASKKWYTTKGEMACPHCKEMQGTTIGVSDSFFNKGETTDSGLALDYEDVGGPPLHPNCKCVLVPVLTKD